MSWMFDSHTVARMTLLMSSPCSARLAAIASRTFFVCTPMSPRSGVRSAFLGVWPERNSKSPALTALERGAVNGDAKRTRCVIFDPLNNALQVSGDDSPARTGEDRTAQDPGLLHQPAFCHPGLGRQRK